MSDSFKDIPPDPTLWRITFRALPGDWGGFAPRLRWLAKFMLRRLGFKILKIEKLEEPGQP